MQQISSGLSSRALFHAVVLLSLHVPHSAFADNIDVDSVLFGLLFSERRAMWYQVIVFCSKQD